jgi:hypothetical protein
LVTDSASYGHEILQAMEPVAQARYVSWALDLAVRAAAVANYCDHVDHNEATDREWITGSGRRVREMACEIAEHEGLDLLALYVDRLRAIEQRNPLFKAGGFEGGELAAEANTWHQLQLAQAAHDRHYHPDVIGLSKFDQLRHYSLHLTKLAGALAEVAQTGEREDFLGRRLPDLLLFGVKLATVSGKALPEKQLAQRSADAQRQLIAA